MKRLQNPFVVDGNCLLICLLNFWRVNGNKFSRLCVTAKQVFCAPGSAAAVERIFSIAGYILSQRRNRLTDNNFENQLFANVNFDIPAHSGKKLRLDN